MLLARTLSIAVCGLLLAGCVGAARAPEETLELTVRRSLPTEFLTVIADTDAASNAIAVSAALYARSDLVITAPVDKPAAQVLAASAAVAFGVPLLLTPAFGSANAVVLESELDRLRATHVLTIGGRGGNATAPPSTPTTDARHHLSVKATATAVQAILPHWLRVVDVPTKHAATAAVADLDPQDPVLLRLAAPAPAAPGSTAPPAAATAEPGGDAPTPRLKRRSGEGPLPPVRPATLRTGGLLVATDDPEQLAGLATARGAAVDAMLVPGTQPNPQASAGLVSKLSETKPRAVIALGAPFATEPSLDWKVRAAVAGRQLPGGGQVLFPNRRFVALYGTPGTPALGVLGEQGLAESITRARQVAAGYAALSDRPVVAMHEIIATVAAAAPGADGNFSNEISVESLRPWVEAAGAAGQYVVLDLQPGRTDFLSQAKRYRSLLELPFVGLALDPEWRLGPNQRHLEQIGAVDVAEVNEVIGWLTELTREEALPQKLLVLHQFRPSMITNRAALDVSHPELAVLLHVDGLGGQPDKQATWAALHAGAPAGLWWGWKNFLDEDAPVLTPAQTLQVSPTPDLITYQ